MVDAAPPWRIRPTFTASWPATSPPAGPLPLDNEGFRDWSLDWGERLFDLGEGLVVGGAAI